MLGRDTKPTATGKSPVARRRVSGRLLGCMTVLLACTASASCTQRAGGEDSANTGDGRGDLSTDEASDDAASEGPLPESTLSESTLPESNLPEGTAALDEAEPADPSAAQDGHGDAAASDAAA